MVELIQKIIESLYNKSRDLVMSDFEINKIHNLWYSASRDEKFNWLRLMSIIKKFAIYSESRDTHQFNNFFKYFYLLIKARNK